MTELLTERLILRRWKDSDLEPWAAMNADPEVREHLGEVLTREQSEASVAGFEQDFDARGYGWFAVEVRATGAFIGFAGLDDVEEEMPLTGVEIGWRLARSAWGHGYATEAARAVLAFGFETLELDEIVALTTATNFRSQAVMQRLGMSRDPADDFLDPTVPEGPLQPTVVFRMKAGGGPCNGDFIVAHHPVSPFEMYMFHRVSFYWDDDERLARMRDHVSRPGGWHVLEIPLRLDGSRDWLEEMVAESRAPVMIVSFFQGELCGIRGLAPGPHAAPWAVRLHELPEPSRYATPKHPHLYPWPLPPPWMIDDRLLSGAAAVDALADWSAATGGEADRAALGALLAEERVDFRADVVSRLLDTLGLSEHVELWHPHLFHGWDDPVKLERSIAALQPGRFRALDCRAHQDCFALVRRREDDYVIEYGEPKTDVLHETVTPSLDKVVAAMNAWAGGETLWRDDFEWIQVPKQPD